ncbi:hypothetical protein EW146_g8872 [Bondarzewia mesenterica]|uniref:J domain-containing protein n=1 Tax=Bondarzewia mesenterica TaxID=1095465 RepID=A0A4S4LB93_9AGAM|nr:hypothetical protein EW146_g8872 [Bondarzewia mesenterica]
MVRSQTTHKHRIVRDDRRKKSSSSYLNLRNPPKASRRSPFFAFGVLKPIFDFAMGLLEKPHLYQGRSDVSSPNATPTPLAAAQTLLSFDPPARPSATTEEPQRLPTLLTQTKIAEDATARLWYQKAVVDELFRQRRVMMRVRANTPARLAAFAKRDSEANDFWIRNKHMADGLEEDEKKVHEAYIADLEEKWKRKVAEESERERQRVLEERERERRRILEERERERRRILEERERERRRFWEEIEKRRILEEEKRRILEETERKRKEEEDKIERLRRFAESLRREAEAKRRREAEAQRRQEEFLRSMQEQRRLFEWRARQLAEQRERARRHAQAVQQSKPSPFDIISTYEAKWKILKGGKPNVALNWASFPFPLFETPARGGIKQITPEAVRKFLFHPDHPLKKPAKERIKAELLRWHPDKINQTLIRFVDESDQAIVQQAAGEVAKILTRLNEH